MILETVPASHLHELTGHPVSNQASRHYAGALPDYGAELPLWGNAFGNIAWQCTKFSPGLLDRLAAWQQEFDAHYHWDRGWESDQIRDRWASQVEDLAADVRAELGTQARLDVKPWGLGS